MPELSPTQRSYIRKRTQEPSHDPSEAVGELNIIPFLDIVVNLIMFLLMTTAVVAFFAQVEAQLPDYRRGGVGSVARPQNTLNLNVTITQSGAIVTGSGGKLAPGCETTTSGRVVSVPKRADGTYDWEGLTNCVAKVKVQFQEERQVILSADPVVEYEHLVAAMDAVRSKGSDELFPEILLSGGVR